MEYDQKKKLIDSLSKEISGKSISEVNNSGIVAKYDNATNSMYFILAGTKYDITDMKKAQNYLKKKRDGHPSLSSERRAYYEIAIASIEALIDNFSQPIDNVIKPGF